MLPASLKRHRTGIMASLTSACASAGASFVPSPVIGTSVRQPVPLMYSSLSRVWPELESRQPRFSGNGWRRQRLSPASQWCESPSCVAEQSAHSCRPHDVLRADDAEQRSQIVDRERSHRFALIRSPFLKIAGDFAAPLNQ